MPTRIVFGLALFAGAIPTQVLAAAADPATWSAATLASAAFNLALFLFHAAFWRLFGWPGSLARSGRVNSAVTQVLNIMLAYCFLVAAIALVWLDRHGDPRPLALAGAGFWLIRAILQPAFFSMQSKASVAITVVFALGFVLHLAVVLG